MDNTNIIPPELTVAVKKYSPYFQEIRKRVLITLVFFVIATFGGFIFYEDIIRFLVRSLSLEGINIVFTSPFQFINLAISSGIVVGVLTIVPLIIFQILSFLKPALKFKEFKTIVGFIPFSIVLFVTGFVFGIVLMKWQIEIFLTRAASLSIGNILDISSLLSTILNTSALMGLGFQFPIILLFLLRFGIVTPKQLSSKRPWIYLGSFIFAILLPPDSILADIILSLPLIFLYEFTLILNYILPRKRPHLSKN